MNVDAERGIKTERILIVGVDSDVGLIFRTLASRDHHSVVGAAIDGVEAIKLVVECAPSLLILDLDGDCLEGLGILRLLKKQYPCLRILVMSRLNPDIYGFRCWRLGASSFVTKQAGIDMIAEVIAQIQQGRRVFPTMRAKLNSAVNHLSDDDLVILHCFIKGEGIASVATALFINEKKAVAMSGRLRKKMGVSSGNELSKLGRRLMLG